MSNKIVFNVYEEDRITGLKTHKYSILLRTTLTATEVVDLLEVCEGFSVYVIEGIALSFVDFSCFFIPSEYVISKLKCIPTANEEPQISLPDKCVISVESENNEEVLIRDKNELAYIYSRYECGASGFGETVLQWVTGHPIEMIFIGGWLWDRVKDIRSFLRNKILKRSPANGKDAPIIFSPRKFHKNLAKLMNIDPFYFQIIGISPLSQGKHTINVRTIKDDEYIVVAKANGDIVSIEKQQEPQDNILDE